MQIIFRFIVGGFIVSLFAALGGVFKAEELRRSVRGCAFRGPGHAGPNNPNKWEPYAAIEARSMIAWLSLFFVYASVTIRLIMRHRFHAVPSSYFRHYCVADVRHWSLAVVLR